MKASNISFFKNRFFSKIGVSFQSSAITLGEEKSLSEHFCFAFPNLIRYIYTDHINLNSFELVCDICYAAKKYMLPALVEECTKYLWRDLYPRNACRAYEFAKLFDEPVLMDKSLQVFPTANATSP